MMDVLLEGGIDIKECWLCCCQWISIFQLLTECKWSPAAARVLYLTTICNGDDVMMMMQWLRFVVVAHFEDVVPCGL